MNTRQVIVLRKDLNMRKGKMCAQASHASMAFLTKRFYNETDLNEHKTIFSLQVNKEELDWLNNSFTKICLSAKDEEELESVARRAEEAGLTVHRIIDKGLTEFNGIPTFTGIAIGPHYNEKFIGITDHLPLL